MRRLAASALLLLGGCSEGASAPPPAPAPAAEAPATPEALQARIADLDHPDPALQRRAAESLSRMGPGALPALDAAGAGRGPTAARARALALKIRRDLALRERAADNAFLASSPALPSSGRIVVAGGALSTEAASVGAFHRYVWEATEDRQPRGTELSSLAAGDAGRGLVAELGPGPYEASSPEDGSWRPLRVSGNAEIPEGVLVLGDRAARELGLARHEIPGEVTVTSRMGAGVLARAWRARVRVRSGAGEREATAWVIPEARLLREESR